MQAAISSKVLRRIKFENITSTNLTNLASSSIGPSSGTERKYKTLFSHRGCFEVSCWWITRFHLNRPTDNDTRHRSPFYCNRLQLGGCSIEILKFSFFLVLLCFRPQKVWPPFIRYLRNRFSHWVQFIT
jgi:hypothetical protein